MRAKHVIVISALMITLAVFTTVFHARATSPPNLAMPDLSGHCLNKGVTFSTSLTASNLTSLHSWQANITFDIGEIATMSYTIGTPFTGQNTISAVNNS